MSVGDPFFVVQGEVKRAVEKCDELHCQWKKIINEELPTNHYDYSRICKELKNNIQNVEWDLEDLEETISIVRSSPHNFFLSIEEENSRKLFIKSTRERIQELEEQLNDPANKSKAEQVLKKSLLNNNHRIPSNQSYSKLHIESDTNSNSYVEDQQQKQTFRIAQEEHLDLVTNQVGVLKNISKSIGKELDSQTIILDDFGNEMGKTANKLDYLTKRFTKLTHLTSERRQWCAVGVLGSSIFVVLLLLIA